MEILTAVLCVGGIGIAFGILLAVASKFFAVEKDPRLDEITEALPALTAAAADMQAVPIWRLRFWRAALRFPAAR